MKRILFILLILLMAGTTYAFPPTVPRADLNAPGAIGGTTPATVFASPSVSKGPAAITTFAGTVSTAGASTTITWSSAADAILAGYDATNPTLGTTIITGAIKQASVTRYVVSWTNSTACVVDTACTLAAATELTSVQLPIATFVNSSGVTKGSMNAAGNVYFISNVGIGTINTAHILNVAGYINFFGTYGLQFNNGNAEIVEVAIKGLAFSTYNGSALTEVMRITGNTGAGTSGNVGIGEVSPTYGKTCILSADNSVNLALKINAAQAAITAADTFIDFRSTTGSEGSIAGTAVAGVIAYNTFTGSHYTQIVDKTGLEANMLLEIVDGKIVDFPSILNTPEEEIQVEDPLLDEDGKALLSVDEEPLTKLVTKIKPATYYKASPKAQLFKTQICQTKGSKKAVGVYLGTDKEGRDLVGSIGTGFIWVSNKGENVEIGDYLISSDMLGCSEKQADDIYRNNTVAKATENIIWEIKEKKRLISCVYLGG